MFYKGPISRIYKISQNSRERKQTIQLKMWEYLKRHFANTGYVDNK